MKKGLPILPMRGADHAPSWRIVAPPHKGDGVARALQQCYPLDEEAGLPDEIKAALDRLSTVKASNARR